jgi:small GTP-binding protein
MTSQTQTQTTSADPDPAAAVLFKLILIGDSGVGKSSLALRFAFDEFPDNSKSTIGVDFMSRTIVHDRQPIRAMIWDTAGQERYRGLLQSYYRGARGALLVFDITNRASFDNIERWLGEMREHGDPNMDIVLVGNKRDRRHERTVTTAEATALASRHNIALIETSAAEAINVDQAFEQLIAAIYNRVHINRSIDDDRLGSNTAPGVKLQPETDTTASSSICMDGQRCRIL